MRIPKGVFRTDEIYVEGQHLGNYLNADGGLQINPARVKC